MTNVNNNQNEINVGVDTGKAHLDIYIRPLGIFFTVSNDQQGIKEAIVILQRHRPDRIIIEATGRLEHAFIVACGKAKLPFVVANPIHVRRFAGAIGQVAKTDKLDAQLIAHYGEAIKPPLSQLKPELIQLMSDLLARRQQLIKLRIPAYSGDSLPIYQSFSCQASLVAGLSPPSSPTYQENRHRQAGGLFSHATGIYLSSTHPDRIPDMRASSQPFQASAAPLPACHHCPTNALWRCSMHNLKQM